MLRRPSSSALKSRARVFQHKGSSSSSSSSSYSPHGRRTSPYLVGSVTYALPMTTSTTPSSHRLPHKQSLSNPLLLGHTPPLPLHLLSPLRDYQRWRAALGQARPLCSQPAQRSRQSEASSPSSSLGSMGSNNLSSSSSAKARSAATTKPAPPRFFEDNIKPEDIKPEPGVEDPRIEENSPSTVGGIVKRYSNKVVEAVSKIPGVTIQLMASFTKWLLKFLYESVTNPRSIKEKWDYVVKVTKEEFHHYALGSKVLWSDIKTSLSIIRRILNGYTLTRRERRQLTRTTADLFRLVPFAFFVIVPFMELLLPVALKVFPNMLPSTFQDNLKEEENMRRELRLRLSLAGFLQETLGEITKKKAAEMNENSATMLTEFVEKARAGHMISANDINKFARHFKDELTLENISRPQLASMCVFMGLRPYGSDNFLRFQLRAKLRGLKEDDQRIMWEGIDLMTKAELREACRERGMRAYGLTQLGYRRQLQQWLDLSINKNVPISLLILSRAFTLESKFTDPATAVADSISSLDHDVVNEVVLEAASGAEERSADIRARKLESIERQNELIEEERKRDAERRKKLEEEKKKKEEAAKLAAAAAATASQPSPTPATVTASSSSSPSDTVKEAAVSGSAPAPASDTATIKEAVAFATKMTDSVPQMASTFVAPKSETLPSEPVMTEDAIVSSSSSSSSGSSATEEESHDKAGQEMELSVAEARALGELARASSVEHEKTTLAKLKAELKKEELTAKLKAEIEKEEKAMKEAIVAAAKEAAAVEEKMKQQSQARIAAAREVASPTAEAMVAPASTAGASAAPPPAEVTEAKAVATTPPPPPPPAANEKKEERSKAKLERSLEKMRNKVASMLDKLEVDIEKVETTIGDKLHMLDKDKDGVLSTAELSEVIMHVLRRHTSVEQANKIAATLDKDADGMVTVEELMDWIQHRSELLEELGSNHDVDSSKRPSDSKSTAANEGKKA